MRIVQITTDNRNQYGAHSLPEPYFGTAPTGLLDGFDGIPNAEVHVISCASVKMTVPAKLADNIWFHQPYVPKLGWGRTLFSGCVLATRELLQDIKPDIVHGQGTERDCAMAAAFSGFPNVLTIHGNMRIHAKRPETKGSFYYKIAAALESFCLQRTDGVVAISRYTMDLVKPLADRTWLLPNAVDQRFFSLTLAQPAVPRILFVGSLDERKNPLGLLQSCERMLRAGQCTLALAGQFHTQGPYGKKVLAMIASLPGVSLLGFLDREKLANEFSRSSILVLPTFEDNCPMVVLEAMAAGLPVAASRVGGVPDLVSHDSDGLMFDPHDANDMRTCIETLLQDTETRERLGAAGRQSALKRFHPRIIAEKHLEIYQEVLRR